ncbi:MAG: hypothetical protein Q8O89_06335 [Nanoarchaeota archaeon]|nr:hypothetical protein [Nanoarchaeota archaeon]
MDLNRINYFQTINEENKMNLRSLQLQYELVKSNNINNQCQGFRFMFNRFITELENNRERLEIYTKQAKVKPEEFDMLKREYFLSQINFWHVSKNLKEACPENSDFVTIIYFYSDKTKCPRCQDQAQVLDYYKLKLKENLLIFALDEEFEDKEPSISLLKQAYDVQAYPTLIINGGELKYEAVIDKEQMQKVLCNLYRTNATRSLICQ